jgi:hypothetical protein
MVLIGGGSGFINPLYLYMFASHLFIIWFGFYFLLVC